MATAPVNYLPPPTYEKEFAQYQRQVQQYTPKPEESTFEIKQVAQAPTMALEPSIEEKLNTGQGLTENEILELLVYIIFAILGQQGG